MENLPADTNNAETSLMELDTERTGKGRKWLKLVVPVIIFLISFILGFLYFVNFDAMARYFILKQGLPIEVDKVAMGLTGRFELERLKYNTEFKKGVEQEFRIEYAGGNVSLPGIIFSNKMKLELNLRGVKIPIASGQISGGNWKIKAVVENISKNLQQWTGDIELTTENAIVQTNMMNSNYTATVKSGLIRGKIKNGILQLDNTDILTDLAKISVSGNSGITNPYNINVDLRILPLEEFGIKYPNEKSMLSALMQKESDIVISLAGPVSNLRPHVKNINIPGF